MTVSPIVKDYLMLHFVVLIWGFTAILGMLISIPTIEMVFYRTFLAFVALGLIFWWRKTKIRIPQKELLKILATGGIICLHWLLFFGAARVSNISVCLAGLATASFWTAFIEPMVNKTKVKWYEVLLGLVIIVGLVIIFSFELDYWLGLVMSVGSALLGACFMVINSRLTKRGNPYIITFYEMLGACLFSVLALFCNQLFYSGEELQLIPTTMDWVWLFLLAGFCTVYAFSVSVELMKRLTAFAVNLTVNLEPVYGIILAVLIFGEKEKMTGGFYLGTLIILLAVCLYPLFNYIYKRRKAKQLLRMQ
ncbi:MAG TPA: DMT family transporter [Cyclobacteriaceae bacterium]|nr:DMT family transporter [Cyclobacteriaceae bacterium]